MRVWRGKGLEIVGEDAETLAQWVRRRFGAEIDATTEEAAFLWLPTPPLPADYPNTASDLRALAVATGEDAVAALGQAAGGEPDHLVAILGATGRGGAGLVAVRVPNPKLLGSHPRSAPEPLSKGFRPGRTPKSVLLNRYFGAGSVIRSSVQRADANWVHGRGRDPRTAQLLDSTVVVVGCGSVGAPVACTLAEAGAGRIVLVEYDDLSWPNVSRHPLGASAVGRNKAEALAERLQADFPHLQIEARACGLHQLLQSDLELLEAADLIIAATGSWAPKARSTAGMLNRVGPARSCTAGRKHMLVRVMLWPSWAKGAVSNAISAGRDRRRSRSWTGRTAAMQAKRSRPAVHITIHMVP